MALLLPPLFRRWFRMRGWKPHRHQLEILQAIRNHRRVLLIAPTGGGKTLCGFLPGLIQESARQENPGGTRILYISPLKALAADVYRNLEVPVREMRLGLRSEVRSGDTPSHVRARQKKYPPDILLTTPESLALLNSDPVTARGFQSLEFLILDELHALADSKRGDLLALNIARLLSSNPELRVIGLSATVARPAELADFLTPSGQPRAGLIDAYRYPGVRVQNPHIRLLTAQNRLPWSGHSGRYALPDVMELIRGHRTSIVFVNTRAQAEFTYRDLQEMNGHGLPLALHHGSLEKAHRMEVEAGLAEGRYRAVVATSSLDLGIDWGDVDLVIQVGPPKGVARLMQRIGRSNHRLDKASRAVIVPTNRMETIEALSAIEAIAAHELDNRYQRTGSLDVLIQHITSCCCAGPVDPDELFREVTFSLPYRGLDRETFDRAVDFIATGGYALRAYDQFKKLKKTPNGCLELAYPRLARLHRMNVGTIVGYSHLQVKMSRGRNLGEVEERFVQGLTPGDTFLFSGQLLQFKGIKDLTVHVVPGKGETPKVPAFAGGKLPLSGTLARRVRETIAQPERWHRLPEQVREWLSGQQERSLIPGPDELLIEAFPHRKLHFLCVHAFAGKNAHHTLGMLVAQRMEKDGFQPLGFVSNDYSMAVWSRKAVLDAACASRLLEPKIIQEELESWLAGSFLMKRTFREIAIVAGLIDRQIPGKRKSGKQVTFSSDILYDVLRQYEPDHLLLQATRQQAALGLVGSDRLQAELEQAHTRHRFIRLHAVSPFAIPVILEVGKESVDGAGVAALLELEAEALVRESGLHEHN